MTIGSQFVKFSEANFFPMPIPQPAFIITSYGSINPSTAPIQRDGNVYTFTSDIVGYTVAVERDNVVLDGAGYTLTGLGNSTGIFLKNRNGVTVRNMRITGFTYGIRLFAEDFMGGTSADNTLSGNILENNEYGIYMSYSSNNLLRNNQMSNNKNNFWIEGSYLSDAQSGYTNDVDASNTVNGKPIIYWINQSDKPVPSDAGYVALVNCKDIRVQNLDLANNGHGVLLVSTTNSQIIKNRVTNSGSGIYLFNCQNNTLAENTLESNSEGAKAHDSSDNAISLNIITENRIGIYVTGSSENNTISENRITRNTVDGINLFGSLNASIQKNVIADNNETGINFFDTRNNKIVANTITGTTGFGIRFWFHSSGNEILQNQVATNGVGILIEDSYENNIVGNTLTENNDWGLRFEGDQNNNIIYQNNFVNNKASEGLQVSIPGIWSIDGMKPGGGNVWDNGATGNYWSDYTTRYPNATEIDGSGIGNTPYYINENNMDRYPLMKPVEVTDLNNTAPIGTDNYGWTTFKSDVQRSSYTDSPAPESNQIFWKFQTGGPIVSSPAVADGIVYVGSADGYMYAVNATTGKKLWNVWIGSGISSPTITFGKVFITCKPGEVIALDMYSGLQVWKQSLGEEAGFGAPLVVGSRVFVNGNQTVHVFNEAVGANLYNEPFISRGIAPLAYDAELIIAFSATGHEVGCSGFEAKDGIGRFWATIGPSNVEKVMSGPAIYEGMTYGAIVNPEGYSTVFALDNGMRIWEQTLDGVTEASPAVAYGTIYIPTDNNAFALNATDGSVKWSRPMNGEYSISSPAVADGRVFFGLDNGYIYALDASTGDLIWSCKTGGAVQSSPAISNGLLFVGSNDGYLYAIGHSTAPSVDPWYLIGVIVSIFVVVAGLLVYFRKRRREAGQA
jgi:parallel beta-helix repeat protein